MLDDSATVRSDSEATWNACAKRCGVASYKVGETVSIFAVVSDFGTNIFVYSYGNLIARKMLWSFHRHPRAFAAETAFLSVGWKFASF